ncbi:hypothetical protein [Streptomyces sp. NPDC001315]|uniref:hypothetical protein n=1 Tax=Streptomyces sp. NPDC001315 TaxID=3364562 RepID=UPI0036A209B4
MTPHVLVTEAGARLAVIAGTIRNTGSGWQLLDDDAHEPSGITGVTEQAGYIELQHAVGAAQVVALTVTVDETYAKSGLRCGASVGLDHSFIYLYSGAAGSAALNPATVSAANGNLWVLGYLALATP